MKKRHQQSCIKLNILICLALTVSVLTYEPITAPKSSEGSSAPLSISQALTFSNVEADPEASPSKHEQTVIRSIRSASSQRIFKKKNHNSKRSVVQRSHAAPAFVFSPAGNLHSRPGADNQFTGMINYIWNQTGS